MVGDCNASPATRELRCGGVRLGNVPPLGEVGRLGPAGTNTPPCPHSQRAERPQGALPSAAILVPPTAACSQKLKDGKARRGSRCGRHEPQPCAAIQRPATLGRHASARPEPGSDFCPSSCRPRGHAHWRAQVPRPVEPSRDPDWLDKVLKSQWSSRLLLATPLLRRGRATAPERRCALQAPRPLRARCSLRPLPPVTCAARMWLGADVGSRCGPGPAHPRGRSAHTEPRRARRLSRLPQCTVELRPQLAGVVPNVAAARRL